MGWQDAPAIEEGSAPKPTARWMDAPEVGPPEDPRDIQAQGTPGGKPPSSALQDVNTRTPTLTESQAGRGIRAGALGAGQVVEGVKMWGATQAAQAARNELAEMDRIDQGDQAAGMRSPFAQQYRLASPERRQQLRQDMVRQGAQSREAQAAALSAWKEYQGRIEKAQGRVPNLTDIEDVEGFGDWLAYNAGQGGVYLVPMMIAALGGPVALAGASYGMALGDLTSQRMEQAAGVPNLAMGGQAMERQTPTSRPELTRVGEEVERSGGTSAMLAVPYTALDVALGPAARIATGGAKRAGIETAKAAAKGGLAAGVKAGAKEVGKELAEESIGEGGQEFLGALQETILDAASLFTPENAKRWLNSAAAGAAGAGMPASASAAAHGAAAAKGKGIPKPGEEKRVDALSEWSEAESVFTPEKQGEETIYRAPNGARITPEQWDTASERVRQQWLTPEEAPVPREIPPQKVVGGIRVDEEIEAAPAPTEEAAPTLPELQPDEQLTAPGAPAEQVTSPRLEELERLSATAMDPVVRKGIDAQIKKERDTLQERARAEEYARLSAETTDNELKADLMKRAIKARGIPTEKPEAPAKGGIQVKEIEQVEALPAPTEQEVAERARWIEQHGLSEEMAGQAARVRAAIERNPDLMKQAAQLHANDDAAFMRAVEGVLRAEPVPASKPRKGVSGSARDAGERVPKVEPGAAEKGAARADKGRAPGQAAGRDTEVKRAAKGQQQPEGRPEVRPSGTERAAKAGPVGPDEIKLRIARTPEEMDLRRVAAKVKASEEVRKSVRGTVQQRLDQLAREGVKAGERVVLHRGTATTRLKLADRASSLQKMFPNAKVDLREADLESVAPAIRGQARVAGTLAKSLGAKVVFFDHGKGDKLFQGFSSARDPETVYIALDVGHTKKSGEELAPAVLAITGHELNHWLEKNHPDLYDEYVRKVLPLLKDVGVHNRELAARYKKRGTDPLSELGATKELIADIWGDFFVDPSFHQEVARVNPSFYRRFADALMHFIDNVIGRLKGKQPFETQRFIADLKRVREITAQTLAGLQQRVGEERAAAQRVAEGLELLSIAPERGPPFFSELERQVRAIDAKAMPAQDWIGRIKSMKGVKPEEIEWTGVTDWLKTQTGKVPKDQVVAYLDANGVRVTETELGEAVPPPGWTSQQSGEGGRWITRRIFHDIQDPAFTSFRKIEVIGRADNQADSVIDAAKRTEAVATRLMRTDEATGRRLFEEAAALERYTEQLGGEHGATQYGEYTLPGGENYRELLLTLPSRADAVDLSPLEAKKSNTLKSLVNAILAVDDSVRRDTAIGWAQGARVGQRSATQAIEDRLQAEGERLIKEAREAHDAHEIAFVARQKAGRGDFKSAHFGGTRSNIVAHVRFNQRIDADGKRVLFIEEIQSDWAQRGKREGFIGPRERQLVKDHEAAMGRHSDLVRRASQMLQDDMPSRDPHDIINNAITSTARGEPWRDEIPRTLPHLRSETQEAVDELIANYREETRLGQELRKVKGSVPPAPFVGKTEAWVGLTIKRMIRYAAENGLDRVAWTNGEQQADRYDLSKHVDEVSYDRSTGELIARKGRANVIEKEMPIDKIDDYVGKEVAQKLRDLSAAQPMDEGHPSEVSVSGAGLKVGGEGMKAFYDKIVPNVVNDVLKKLGGGRVTSIGMDTSTYAMNAFDPSTAEVKHRGGPLDVYQVWARDTPEDPLTLRGGNWSSREAAEAYAKSGGTAKQLGFDITPEMREMALGGLPQFRLADASPRSSVALRAGKEKLKTRDNTTRAIAEALEARTRKIGAVDPYDTSDAARDKIASAIADEVIFELKDEGAAQGVGWYSHNYPRALDRMADVYPEMKQKPYRDLLTALMAVFSNGQKVNVNARMAMDAYDAITRGGKSISEADFGANRETSHALEALQRTYEKYGVEGTHQYLLEEISVADMNKAMREAGEQPPGDYTVNMSVPRAAVVLGPKIGVFYANLMGSSGYLTMDRWWTRSFNRLRGSLIPWPTEAGIDRLRELLSKEQGRSYKNVDEDNVIIAAVPYWYDYVQKNYKGGTDLEKAANTVIKAAALELEDAPMRGSDREFMVSTAKRTQEILAERGYNLSIADIQAAEWFYEKKLYSELGARESGTVGYEEAINALVEGRGESDRPARPIAESVRPDAGQAGTEPGGRTGQATPPENEDVIQLALANQPLAQLEGERKFERLWFDKFNRTLQAEEAAGRVGAQVTDPESIRLAEKLFHGRAQYEGEEFERKYVEPLGAKLKAAKRVGLTVRDADDYFMAKHAPERNATMAQRDPAGRSGLSGMTNQQAAQILASFTPEQTQALRDMEPLVYGMAQQNLDRLVNAGLITAQTRAALRAQWRNYVPLKTLDQEDAARGTGRGFELWKSDIKTALGRQSKAGSPIASLIMDSTRGIVRAEKARVEQSIWAMAQKPEMHDIMRPYDPDNPPQSVMSRKLDKNTGQVTEVVDPMKVQEQTLHLMINGEDQRVYVPDELLRQQLRKAGDYENLAPLLDKIAVATRTIGRTLTEWNPSFTIPNAFKDAISAVVRARGIKGMSAARMVAVGIPKAWAAIVQNKLGNKTTGLGATYEQFKQLGGKTGAYGISDAQNALDRLSKLGAEIGGGQDPGILRKAGRKAHIILDGLSAANEVLEYATRLAAFEEAKRAGYTNERAAEIGKEISVNFNRSGELSRAMNSLFVFFNAALQGLYATANFMTDKARVIEPNSVKGKRVRRGLYAMAGIGFLLQGLNEAMGGDDDETGEKNVNTLSDYQLDSNATILFGDSSKGLKIPLPPEYKFAYALGRRFYRAASERQFGREAGGIASNLADAVLPVRLPESSNAPTSAMKALYPTVGLPWLEIAANENFMGAPIVPEQKSRDAPQPWHTISRRDTSDIAKSVSELVNTATGGDRIEPGLAQKAMGKFASPEAMQHIVSQYTGGLGQLAVQSKNIAKSVSGDKEAIDINKTPVVSRFAFAQPKGYAARRYRELATDFQYAQRRMKAGEEIRDDAVLGALGLYESTEKELRRLYPTLRQAEERGDSEQAESIREQITLAQKSVIRAYAEAKRAAQ